MNMIFLFNITCYSFTGIESIHQSLISAIPQILHNLISFKPWESSLFSYHINYQSTHTNLYQTHYFQTIITTTNISIITFFQSFIHIIHYPFIKSNITIKHYQFCVTHTITSQRNDIHFIHATIRIPNYAIPH